MSSTPIHAQQLFVALCDAYSDHTLIYLLAVKEHSQHTIGVEFSSRTVKLGEKRIKLQVRMDYANTLMDLAHATQLWDTAGQERFRDRISQKLRESF